MAGAALSAARLRASATVTEAGIAAAWELRDGERLVSSGTLTLQRAEGQDGAQFSLPRTADWALFAALPDLVRHGGTVVVEAPASRRALADAAEVSRAWASFGQGAAPVALTADEIIETMPEGEAEAAIFAVPAGADPGHAVPEGVAVAYTLMPGPLAAGAAARAAETGRRLVAFSATGTTGPEPAFLGRVTRLAAACHLLSREARLALLLVEQQAAPAIGAPASPAHAAAFLSGGALPVVPLLPEPLPAPALVVRTRAITAWFEQGRCGGATRRSLVLEGLADRPAGERVTLWWDMPGEPHLPEPPVLDQMIAAAVLPALARGQDLLVKGPLSRLAAVNLTLLSAARAAWGAPAPRGPVAVMAETLRDGPDAPPPARAVLTFSGGADAFYSLLWRTGPDRPEAEPPLAGAVLTQGFDIPLSADVAFEAHRARLAPVLEARGVALHVVRTNGRALNLAAWEPAAMPLIASAVAQFSHLYGVGLLGGARPYPLMTLPIIQSPLLDRALSGAWFFTATDAGSVGRTDKIALIARHPEAMAALRVCYDEGRADFSRNCCACPKCLRTMLNFRAVGVAEPTCFAHVPPIEDLVELPFWKHDDVIFAREIVAAAARYGTEGPWSARLAARADAWQPPPTTIPGRLRAKISLWAGRMAQDPLGTPMLALRKGLARLARAGRRA